MTGRDRAAAAGHQCARLLGGGRLIDPYQGEPAELRWLSIHPEGQVIVRRSDNLIAWSVAFGMWVQVCLLRHVYRVVDPESRGSGLAPMLMIGTKGRGVVITTHHVGRRPANRMATVMLVAVGGERELFGTVAWVGAQHPATGFHADLSRVDELRAVAAHCRSG